MSQKPDKELQFYNIVVCGLVASFISQVYDGNMFVFMILIVVVLLFLYKVIKVEKYIKEYLNK
ncbi:MAG: hypothetical protein ACRDA3_02135 [Peptostreptococcaceae bacterium]